MSEPKPNAIVRVSAAIDVAADVAGKLIPDPAAKLGIGLVRVGMRAGMGAFKYVSSRRARAVLRLLATDPEFDFDHFRLSKRGGVSAQELKREIHMLLGDADDAIDDEALRPLAKLIVFVARTPAEKRFARELARLLISLHAGEIEQLRVLVELGLTRTNDNPVLFWHDRALTHDESNPDIGTLIGVGDSAVMARPLPSGLRLFRALKDIGLGRGHALSIGAPVQDGKVPQGEEHALSMHRADLQKLADVIGAPVGLSFSS